MLKVSKNGEDDWLFSVKSFQKSTGYSEHHCQWILCFVYMSLEQGSLLCHRYYIRFIYYVRNHRVQTINGLVTVYHARHMLRDGTPFSGLILRSVIYVLSHFTTIKTYWWPVLTRILTEVYMSPLNERRKRSPADPHPLHFIPRFCYKGSCP